MGAPRRGRDYPPVPGASTPQEVGQTGASPGWWPSLCSSVTSGHPLRPPLKDAQRHLWGLPAGRHGRLWGRSCREHQEGLLADDSSSSEIHASWGCSAGLTAPLSGQRTAGPWERPRGWPGAGPGQCRQRASLSDFLRALRGPGSASRHVWHSGLGCKIYPARQLVKELCNRRQLTETTSLSSWEARSLAVPPWPQAQGRSGPDCGWQGP